MTPFNTFVDFLESDSADTACGVGKILVNDAFFDADNLENLRRLVGLQGRNTHFRSNFDDTVEHRLAVIVNGDA